MPITPSPPVVELFGAAYLDSWVLCREGNDLLLGNAGTAFAVLSVAANSDVVGCRKTLKRKLCRRDSAEPYRWSYSAYCQSGDAIYVAVK